jgi:hypothetical protein
MVPHVCPNLLKGSREAAEGDAKLARWSVEKRDGVSARQKRHPDMIFLRGCFEGVSTCAILEPTMRPDAEQLARWILDATLDLQVARAPEIGARQVAERVVVRHRDRLCPEGGPSPQDMEALLYPLAEKVVRRHLDPGSALEEQVDGFQAAIRHEIEAGRQPSGELLEAQLEAAERLRARGEKRSGQVEVRHRLAERGARREGVHGPASEVPPMTPEQVLDLLFETEASGLEAEGLSPEHLGEEAFSELIFRRVLERHSERLQNDPALGVCLLGVALPRMAPEALRALTAELRARGHLGFADALEAIVELTERQADTGDA